MRVTCHNGRGYGAKHNDRNFDTKNAEHIDSEKTKDNKKWHFYSDDAPDMTFEEVEQRFYSEVFSETLKERNKKYIDTRNYKLVKTIEDYRKSRKTCPEESIVQVGKKGKTVTKDEMWSIYWEYAKWRQKKYPRVVLLNAALHTDENGANHVQEQFVWVSEDKKGNFCVSQSGALSAMGVERLFLDKKEGRHNNAKITYTADCRKKLQEIAKSHGLEIEVEPKERSKTGLSLIEYQARQEEEKLRLANNALIMLQNKATSLVESIGNTYTAKDGMNFQRSLQKMCNELKIPTPQPKIKEK